MCFSQFFKVGSSRSRWVSLWGLFSWLVSGWHFTMTFSFVVTDREKEQILWSLLKPHRKGPILMNSFKPNYLSKAPSPNTITSGYGFNIWIRGTHTFGPWQVYTQVYMSHSMLRAHTHTWTLHLFPTSVHSEGQGVITPQYQRAKLAPWSWL